MIQSNEALCQEINSIINILKASGNNEFARKLFDSLTINTIASEILGEIRLVFEELDESGLPAELGIQVKIDGSLKYINEIL